MMETTHPATADLDLGSILQALADPHRRRVIAELAADRSDPERTCHSFGLPVSKQTSTYHFKTLRASGLIRDFNYGNRKGIRLRRADIDARFPGLLDLLAAEHSRTRQRAETTP